MRSTPVSVTHDITKSERDRIKALEREGKNLRRLVTDGAQPNNATRDDSVRN